MIAIHVTQIITFIILYVPQNAQSVIMKMMEKFVQIVMKLVMNVMEEQIQIVLLVLIYIIYMITNA
jgi:hypothetical protein